MKVNEGIEQYRKGKANINITDKEGNAQIEVIQNSHHFKFGANIFMFYWDSTEPEKGKTRMYYDPQKLYAHMDLYSKFKKPLQVAEITIPSYLNSAQDE